MSVESIRITKVPSDELCGFCYDTAEESEGKNWAVHTGEHGHKHPFHQKCFKSMLKGNPQCPMCNVSIDISSLMTNSEVFGSFILMHEVLINATAQLAITTVGFGLIGELVALIGELAGVERLMGVVGVVGVVGGIGLVGGGFMGAKTSLEFGGDVMLNVVGGAVSGAVTGAVPGAVSAVFAAFPETTGPKILIAASMLDLWHHWVIIDNKVDSFVSRSVRSIADYCLKDSE